MPAPPPEPPTLPRRGSVAPGLPAALGTLAALAAATMAFLQAPAGTAPRAPGPATAMATASGTDPAAATASCALGPAGRLEGRFYGALDVDARWSGRELACDGMEKPGGQGLRLYFAGPGPAGGRVAVLLGLAGASAALGPGERPANITVIDEGTGRFFSSAGQDRCFVDLAAVQPVPAGGGRPAGHRVEGLAYCVGALPSVGDRASLTLGGLRFAGWVGTDGG